MLLDLITLLKEHEIHVDSVLQPGAHFGQEQELYDKLGIPDNNRYYFEPVPATFQILQRNIGSRGHLFNYALGDKNETVDMFLEEANSGQSSSTLPPLLHLKQYPHIQFNKTIKVPMIRLEDYMDKIFPYEEHLGKSWLVNCDTQGNELSVLRGMEKLLPLVECIVCEVNKAELYQGCARAEEIEEFLARFGFCKVAENYEGVTWGDAMFIKAGF